VSYMSPSEKKHLGAFTLSCYAKHKKTCYSFYFLESFPNVVLRYRNSMEAFKKGF
jgi:hypothetical protein